MKELKLFRDYSSKRPRSQFCQNTQLRTYNYVHNEKLVNLPILNFHNNILHIK